MSKSTVVNFAESTSQSRSQTITIPNLKSVVSVTPNTGTATYTVSGNNITINVSGGTYTRYTTSSYTPSKSASTTLTNSTNSFPATTSYNDGTYSGTLSKSGGATSSTVPGASKTATGTQSASSGDQFSTCSEAWAIADGNLPSTMSYSDGQGYTGTLSLVSHTHLSCSTNPRGDIYDGQNYVVATTQGNYSGTVKQPDTTTWSQGYSGTVYAATQTTYTYYYAYDVTVVYIDNTAPTQVIKIGATVLTNNQNILVTDKNPITINITPSDIDTTDTLQYKIDMRSINRVPFTDAVKDTSINYQIQFSDLVLGNNLIAITIKDSAGDSNIFSFTLRNKTPNTLSNKTVLDVLQAMGYSNTSFSSLQTLKPDSYSGALSMSDIINYLT